MKKGNMAPARGHPVGRPAAFTGASKENAGYYYLMIAIFCGLNANQAWMLYWHGPDYPACRRIMQKKVREQEPGAERRSWIEHRMQIMRKAGYSPEAVEEAFGYVPSGARYT